MSRETEYSKRLLITCKYQAWIVTIASFLAISKGYDSTFPCCICGLAWGVYGAAITFYLNKAKFENVMKGRLEFIKEKVKLEGASTVQDEVSSIEQMASYEMDKVVSEEITVNS